MPVQLGWQRKMPAEPATTGGDGPRSSQRIAFGTVARSAGEVLAKLASLAFFIAIARELGEGQFGDFIYGLSLSTVLLTGAGLGMQELIAREVASDHVRVDALLWNVVVLKGLMLLVLLGVITAIVAIQGFPFETGLSILIVSVGIGFEYQANSFFAVLQGYERQHLIATSLIVNRVATAALGIGVLLAGGGLVAVAIVFTVGSALGLGTAFLLMQRYVVRPEHDVDRAAWPSLIRASLPLGVFTVLATVSLRSSVVLLGFLGASSVTVGQYGASFRLIEALLFISSAFSAALLPWFSRHRGSGPVPLSRGFEMSLKAVIAATLPLALALALFAEPVITTLYGAEYDGAVTPLRILAAMTVLVGINGVITAVLIGRNRPREYTVPAVLAIALTLILSFFLIPPYGAVGAAITAVAGAAGLAGLTVAATTRLVGSIAPLRVAVAPLAAGAAMALVAVLLAGAPWVPVAVASAVAYGAAFLGIERVFFPGDFAWYAGILSARPRLQERPSQA